MLDQIENTQQTLSGGYTFCWTRQWIHSKHYQVDIQYVGLDSEYTANIIRWISILLDQIDNIQQTLSGGYTFCWTRSWIHSKHYQVDIQYVGLDREYTANIIRWISILLDQIENTQQTLSGEYPVCWTRQRIHSKHYQVDIHFVELDREYTANIIRQALQFHFHKGLIILLSWAL